jgi:F420-0:gamma-glutamyl ligase-like protein
MYPTAIRLAKPTKTAGIGVTGFGRLDGETTVVLLLPVPLAVACSAGELVVVGRKGYLKMRRDDEILLVCTSGVDICS